MLNRPLPNKQEETREQMIVVAHVKHKWPDALFTSALGGIKTTIGQAVKLKKLGYRRSWPDLTFLEPRGPYHGLVVELKKTGGRLDDKDQEALLLAVDARGYRAICCIGYKVAIKAIDEYLSLKAFGRPD